MMNSGAARWPAFPSAEIPWKHLILRAQAPRRQIGAVSIRDLPEERTLELETAPLEGLWTVAARQL